MEGKAVNITEQVHGKLEEGHMNLYLDKVKVGRIVETAQGQQFEMAEGFDYKDEKIIRYESADPANVQSYVEGCDQGWC